MANRVALCNGQSQCEYPHHITLLCPWTVNTAAESSSNVSHYAPLIFPSKNIPINTAADPRKVENKGCASYFQNPLGLPQHLPCPYLHRHPYSTLTKYPRKSRSKNTSHNSPITTTVSIKIRNVTSKS